MSSSPARRRLVLIVIVLVVLALGAMAVRSVQSRRAQQAARAAPAAPVVVDLVAADLAEARMRSLATGLPISGTLKAVDAVLVKARVAGELQNLRVREGDRVQAGQLLGQIDPVEVRTRLRQAQEQADAARTQIDIAQRQYDNNRALVDQGFISRTALDTSQATLQSAQATHRAALAAVDLARKSLDDAVLRAPISGQIAQRLAQPGERVAVDTRIVEIVDLSRMEMEATLAAGDALALRVGQTAQLQVEGADGAAPVAARVARINPSTQAGSRSVLAYLAVEPVPGLRQGMFVQGVLQVGEGQAVSVPLSAVRTDKPEPYVQTVQDGRVRHRAVQPGPRGQAEGETMVAVPDLPAGSLVLRGSAGVLPDGTQVRLPAAPKP